MSARLPVPSHRSESALHQEPEAGAANVGGEARGVTDCFWNRVYRAPFTRDVSGAVKLCSHERGSGMRGLSWSLSSRQRHEPWQRRSMSLTGDGTGAWEGPEPVRPKAVRSDATAEGPRQAPAATRDRAHRATAPTSQVLTLGDRPTPKSLQATSFLLLQPSRLTQYSSVYDHCRRLWALGGGHPLYAFRGPFPRLRGLPPLGTRFRNRHAKTQAAFLRVHSCFGWGWDEVQELGEVMPTGSRTGWERPLDGGWE